MIRDIRQLEFPIFSGQLVQRKIVGDYLDVRKVSCHRVVLSLYFSSLKSNNTKESTMDINYDTNDPTLSTNEDGCILLTLSLTSL